MNFDGDGGLVIWMILVAERKLGERDWEWWASNTNEAARGRDLSSVAFAENLI